MKHYVFMTKINEEKLEAINREFDFVYKVNLDNKKYRTYDSVVEKWNAIMSDTFLRCSGNDKGIYVSRFLELLFSALYGKQSDIIRPDNVETKGRQDEIQEFRKYIEKMQTLLDDYSMYEPDVWMNAYLSIQYIKAIHNLPDDENLMPSAIPIDSDLPYYVKAKGIEYVIPFESYQEGFCEGYVKKVAGKDHIQVLGAYIDPRDKKYMDIQNLVGFYGYEKRVELKLGSDMKYTRWCQQKVYSLEKSKEFKTEDKAMFHKTIDGVLVRNLVDTMISTGRMYDVEDYLYLLDKLCMSKSLNWQNLIGCLYIEVSCLKRELTALELWADIEVMFEAWFRNLETINRRLELFVEGLIYVIYNQDSLFDNITEVEERCKDALEKIEKNPIPFSEKGEELIYNEWTTQKKELRVFKSVELNHRQYCWIYAIMQRYVIDGLTPRKSVKSRKQEIDWDDIVESIALYYNIVVIKNKLNKEIDNTIEGSKKEIDIGKICYDLSQRKRGNNTGVTENRITKEELLKEIKDKVIKTGQKDEVEKISDITLKKIWKAFISVRAGGKHTNFLEKSIDYNFPNLKSGIGGIV